MMPILRSTTACVVLLLSSAPVAHAQSEHVLFSATLRTHDVSEGSIQLAPAEHRMRIVELLPFSDDGRIDLSRPLDVELFDGVRYTVRLRRHYGSALEGLEVWKGRVADPRFDHLPHYLNTVFVHNPATGKLVANIGTDKGFFQILPTVTPGEYRVRDCLVFGNELCRMKEGQRRGNAASRGGNCGGACDETDQNGRYVIDVFAGYSASAAAVAGDLQAHAQANIETVNMGLVNSLVGSTYLRLVGTGITPNNPGIITSVLDDAWTWFAPAIEELAPDLVAVFQTPTNAPGSAGGWGYVPGRSSVNGVAWPTVFRHEVGHNVGGGHCHPDNAEYLNGHDNGHWRTHLCGNDVNFYSTPLVNDDQGTPIGNAATADMARAWEEEAPWMATYAMHRVPYFEGDECAGLICLPQHWGDPIEYITRVRFNTIDNLQSDPAWNCPEVTGYSDHTQLSTDVLLGATHALTINSNYSWEESTLRAWIDWNSDGILGAAEQVAGHTGNGPWTSQVTVPMDAVVGAVRLRVRLQYGLDNPANSCNSSGYSSGETEDYTVNVLGMSTAVMDVPVAGVAQLVIHPNPVGGMATLLMSGMPQGPAEVRLINAAGQQVRSIRVRLVAGTERLAIDTSGLPAGVYACELRHATHGVHVARLVKE